MARTPRLIGTDSSIAECRRSGYVVMETRGLTDRKGHLRKDVAARFTVSNPDYWTECGRVNLPALDGAPSDWIYLYDVQLSWDDLWVMFLRHEKGIRSGCDWENAGIDPTDPTIYDMVHLASDVCWYCGLE